MPFTALGGSAGTITVGDVSLGLFPQALHPNVMAYVAAQTANGYSPSRERVDALNNLVWGLVGEGLWDLCDVIYPFLGGTTGAAHKWNLKNVADTDAAFRINWVLGGAGVITYSELGVQMTTVTNTTFGNTFYTPTINAASTSNVHLSAYLNIAPTVNGTAIMGALTGTAQTYQMGRISTGANPIFGAPNLPNSLVMVGTTNAAGFYCPVRNSINSSTFYRNGISIATSSNTTAAPSVTVHLLNRNGSAAASNGRLAFVSMGAGMTAQQSRDFYTLVQAYQTALGRQV